MLRINRASINVQAAFWQWKSSLHSNLKISLQQPNRSILMPSADGLVAIHNSSLHFNAFTAQIRQAFGKVIIIVFGINRAGDRCFRQIGIRQAGVATMVFIAPRRIRPVAALLHFVHDKDVVGVEQIGAVGEDVVDGGVRPAPTVAAQGGAFAVLAEQLGAGELGDKGLVPQAHK